MKLYDKSEHKKNVFAFSFGKIVLGGKKMAKKGQKFKIWSAEEKYKVIVDEEERLILNGMEFHTFKYEKGHRY